MALMSQNLTRKLPWFELPTEHLMIEISLTRSTVNTEKSQAVELDCPSSMFFVGCKKAVKKIRKRQNIRTSFIIIQHMASGQLEFFSWTKSHFCVGGRFMRNEMLSIDFGKPIGCQCSGI